MLIGVPKEIKDHEYRVGLTPDSVNEAVLHGHEVLVEHGAGRASAPATPTTPRRVRRSRRMRRRSSNVRR